MTVHRGTIDSRNRIFDSTSMSWEPEAQPGGGPGGGSSQVSVKEILTTGNASVLDSTQNSVGVTIREGTISASTTVNVSSLAGPVIVRSSAADALGTVYQSTFGDLRATVHNSTIGDLLASVQQNSSVWQVQPGSTNWPKAAGLAVDSSNVQSVKLDGSTLVSVQPQSTAFVKNAGFSLDSSNALNVKLDGSTRINLGSTAADNAVTATLLAGSTLATRPLQSTASDLKVSAFLFDSTGNAFASLSSASVGTERGIVARPVTGQRAGSTVVLGALNANAEILVDGYNGCALVVQAGTLDGTIRCEQSWDGSTVWVTATTVNLGTGAKVLQVVLTNPNGATYLAPLLAAGAQKARVRVTTYNSGSANASGFANTTTDPLALAAASQPDGTAPAFAFPGQIGGVDEGGLMRTGRIVATTPTSTDYGFVTRSFNYGGDGGSIETSTFAASTKTSTARGLVTRPAIPDCTSIGVRLVTAGDNTILSSGATSLYVYALQFSAALPTTGPSTGSSGVMVRMQGGTTGATLWQWCYQLSSLMSAASPLAVMPPAYLFKTAPATLLNANATSSGGCVSVAAWRE